MALDEFDQRAIAIIAVQRGIPFIGQIGKQKRHGNRIEPATMPFKPPNPGKRNGKRQISGRSFSPVGRRVGIARSFSISSDNWRPGSVASFSKASINRHR